MKTIVDEECENVIYLIGRPNKHSAQELIEMIIREAGVGNAKVPFKDGKIFLWWEQSFLENGKLVQHIYKIEYADVKEKTRYLCLDEEGKLLPTNSFKHIQTVNSVLLYDIESEPAEYVLKRIKEVENQKEKEQKEKSP